MIEEVEYVVVINANIQKDLFKIRDQIFPDFRVNANGKDNVLHLIEADARYTEGLANTLIKRLDIKEEKKLDEYFDLVIISRTLHHLRSGKCQIHNLSSSKKSLNIECVENPKGCVFEFETKILRNLVSYGKKTLV